MKKGMIRLIRTQGEDRGFSILEYAAGAAVILGVVWGGMNVIGVSMGGLLQSISTWIDARTGDIGGNPPPP